MSYHLVHRHRAVFHLLASGEFDVVGTNLRQAASHYRPTSPSPLYMLMGNFWWASVLYLRSLDPFVSRGHLSSKYDAELYILSASAGARVHVMHDTTGIVTIGEQLYPMTAYVAGVESSGASGRSSAVYNTFDPDSAANTPCISFNTCAQ